MATIEKIKVERVLKPSDIFLGPDVCLTKRGRLLQMVIFEERHLRALGDPNRGISKEFIGQKEEAIKSVCGEIGISIGEIGDYGVQFRELVATRQGMIKKRFPIEQAHTVYEK